MWKYCRKLPSAGLIALLCPPLLAQVVPQQARPRIPVGPTRLFIVDDTPTPCRFSALIQPAVDAAGDGDVVLVKAGTYAGFTIDGKSLCVIGEGQVALRNSPGVLVKNLGANQRVILRGLDLRPRPSFHDNAGPIWVEGCTWDSYGWTAACISSTVGLGHCAVEDQTSYYFTGLEGAFRAQDSLFFAYQSTFLGAAGFDSSYNDQQCEDSGGLECYYEYANPGSKGVLLSGSSQAYLIGCSLSGGRGGAGRTEGCRCYYWPPSLPGECGGDALRLESSTAIFLRETVLTSGLPDCDGNPVTGTGALETSVGRSGELVMPAPLRSGQPLQYTVHGPAGREVHLAWGFQYTPAFVPEWKGVSVLPLDSVTRFVGVLPPAETLTVTENVGDLVPRGSQAAVYFVQLELYNPANDSVTLGTPSALVVVRDPCP